MKPFYKIFLIPLMLSLTACSTASFLKSNEPPQTIYSLRAASAPPALENGPAQILEISKPSVPPGFETDRIALYTNNGQKLDYYAGAKWPDIFDTVIQEFTRRTVTSVLPYIVAVTSAQSLQGNYRLQVKINEFQPVYGSDQSTTPNLSVNVEFNLIRLPDETIVSSFTLAKTETAASNRLDVIAFGLEKILQEIEIEAFTRLDKNLRKNQAR